jgi:uncharacterized protein (DUF1800 family)
LEQVLVAKYNRRKAAVDTMATEPGLLSKANPLRIGQDGRPSEQAAEIADQVLASPKDARMRAIMALPVDRRILLAEKIRDPQKSMLMNGFAPHERELFLAMNGGPDATRIADNELQQTKILRAILSQRQLQEVMTDFWFNHFNVFQGKDADHYLLTSYERDVIRPHALGKFEDLLVATAQSPAMLFYLDNWLSVGPNSDAANGVHGGNSKKRAKANGPVTQAKGKRNGLNENYGRELMELHTLGVNGGYTQKDVTEVARVLTGWTLKQPFQGGEFKFDERMHEPGPKIVLGHRIKPNGQKEGFEVLHLLAHDPSTAKFISTKLAMRFVSDDPPPTLVSRMAMTFLSKDGDIREVLRTLFNSPEFWAADDYRAKVKTPLEFVVSALRASGADISDALPITRQLQNMGMPLYGMQPPTGYSMKADAWVNSSALLARMNFALVLAAGKMKGARVDSELLASSQAASPADPAEVLQDFEKSLLAGDVSQQTHDTIAARLDDPKITQRRLDDPAHAPNVALIEGLLLGSPEFQKR